MSLTDTLTPDKQLNPQSEGGIIQIQSKKGDVFVKMMTKAIERAMPDLVSTEKIPKEDKKLIVKFFCPWGAYTWYVYEGELLGNGDWEFFGLTTDGRSEELGYFKLSDLTDVTGPGGLKIERDRHAGVG